MRTFLCLICCLAVGCRRPTPAGAPGTAPGEVRVVSLAPCLTEIICAIGAADCLVGRSSACHFPPDVVNRVPVAGDFGVPKLEALAKCAPQLVLTVDLEDPNTASAIARLGIRHEHVPCQTLDDIPRAITTVGRLLHREAAADKLAGEIVGQLTALRRAPRPAKPPRVFLEIWGDPLMTAGKRAFLTELIELAGGQNVLADVDRDFFPVSPETVLARNPEVVILLEAPDAATASRLIAQRPGWSALAAVRDGRVCSGLDRNTLEVPGPRVLAAVKILRTCLTHEP